MARRILVAEDSPTQAEALRSFLEVGGYEVAIATSGEDALRQFDIPGDRYDVVISDIIMPGPLDGYEVCRRIKAGPGRETPVILLTSLTDPLDIINGLESGADNFITKPYDGRHLLERLGVLFDTKNARRKSKMRMGVQVFFMGREFTISSDREQILDLLISTFEDAVRQNRELRQREEELVKAKADLARASEGALRESEARFRQVTNHIKEAFFLVDLKDYRFLYISPTWSEIWGRSLEEAYANSQVAFQAIHPEDQPRMLEDQQAVAGGIPTTTVFRVIRPNGAMRWVRRRAFPVRDESGRVYRLAGVSEDITDQIKLEEQFRQAQKMESIGRLAGGVAHDFNNLLTVILGESEIALEDIPAGAQVRESLEEIRKAGERAVGLTRQLLAFSRQQVLEQTVFDPNALILDLDKMLRRLLGEDVALVTPKRLDVGLVKADRGQIEQVVVNLAVNARDAMPAGGNLTMETSDVTLDEEYARLHPDVVPGEYVCLSVSDTGSGMTGAVKARIFEPFFTTKEQGRGTGLGLATCFGIVKQAGGHIAVYSELNIGTTMKVYLPRVAVPASPVKAQTSKSRRGGTETILLVEDDSAVRQIATKMLEKHGYRVQAVGTAEEASRRLHAHEPVDLLVTDVVLPGMNGRELADLARQLRPGIKVLFASGYTNDVALRSRLVNEGEVLVNKPFTVHSLTKKVGEVLDTHERG